MKNKFKIIIAAMVFAGLWSCSDEENFKILQPKGEFEIVTPEAGTSIVLTPELQTNPALTLTWESADFTTPTQITYTVEMAVTGTDFANIVTAATTNGNNVTWSVADLNGAAVAAGLTPFAEGSVDVRVKATAGGQDMYSSVVNFLITPYSTDLPKIGVAGNHQGWNPPTAPPIAASSYGETDYEGFVYLDGGFKFVGPESNGVFSWNTNWGDDGSFAGALSAGGSDIIASAGYYRVRANTAALTYSTEPMNWGIIGNGTPTGWDSDTDLTYDPATKKLSVVINLTAGLKFKFRANNAWDVNFGGSDGSLSYNGADIDTPSADGSYKVELDLSVPRVPTYTVTAQ